MPRELVLLAGLHKTATTSIQATCVANADRLREAGWFYPLRLGGVDDRGNHGSLMLMFRDDPLKMGLLRQLDVSESPEQRGLIERSREIAMGRLESAPADIRLLLVAEGASTMSAAELGAMKKWFTERHWQMRVVCHVRHLSGWLSSMVAQRVNGQMRMTIASAVEEFRQAGGIVRPRIEAMRSVFPDLRVFSHEAAVRHRQGPPGFFLRQLGVRLGGWTLARANEGRSDCATRAMSLVNERFGLANAEGALNAEFIRTEDLGGLHQLPGRKFTLRAHEVAPLERMLRQENEWLGQAFGPEFVDPSLAFGNDPCEWTPASRDALEAVTGAIPQAASDWLRANLERLGLQAAGPRA